MSAATAAAQTVENQNLMVDRDRSHSFQMDKLEVSDPIFNSKMQVTTTIY